MTRMIVVFAATFFLSTCAGEGNSADVRRQAKEAIQTGAVASSPQEDTPTYADNIQITLPQATIAAGATECFDVKVSAFRNILAMQYTLQWDKNVLSFAEVKGFRLPFMSNDNFGATLAPNGILTAVWIENSLKGVTLPDGDAIYQICFKATGKPGQSSNLSVTSQPTAIEVVTVGDQVWGIKAAQGKIAIQ